MALHLVRHAEAGDRHADGDEFRALTTRGHSQARAVADLLADRPVRSILTSRYARCRQTVEPLADRLGLTVADDDALAEEADIEATWERLVQLAAAMGDVVVCSHGNVLQAVLDRLHRRAVALEALPPDTMELSFRKGAVWTLEPGGDQDFRRAVQVLRKP